MPKKHMTIGDLAGMVKRGFDEMGKKFDAMAGGLNEMKRDLADVKERLENLEKLTLKQYNFEIRELKRRVRHLEDLFAVK